MSSFEWPPKGSSLGAVVTSLNSLTGDLTLAAGANITITPSGGNTLTIASTASGSVTSVALTAASIFTVTGSPITSSGIINLALANETANLVFSGPSTGSPAAPTFRSLVAADIPTLPYLSTTLGTANGLSVSTNTLSLGLSSTSTTGALSSTDWNTFNNKQSALTLGDLTDAGTDGIIVTGGTGAVVGSGTSIAQHVADATHNGYLSSVDWVSFNAKQAAGNYITALTTDVVAAGPGSVAATIQANVVTDAKLRQSSGLSLIGRSANSTGNVADITAASDNQILRRSGTSIGFGSIDLSQSNAVGASILPVGNGGTGIASGTSGGIPYFSSSSTIASSGALTANRIVLGGGAATTPTVLGSLGTTTTVLHGNAAGAPTFGAVDLVNDVTGTLAIGSGGTGQVTKAAAFDALSPMNAGGQIIYGGASGTGTALANGSAGQFLKSNGTTLAPSWAAANFSLTTVAKTANYTLTTSDNTVTGDSSGGTFTFTLPTAVGNTQYYTMIKTDSSATVISIATTSGQTISGAASTKIATQGEVLTVYSDGANWLIYNRFIPSVWVSYTPVFSAAWGTVSISKAYSRRVGANLEIQIKATSGSATASTGSMTIGYNGTSANVSIDPVIIPANSSNIYSLLGHLAQSSSGDTISVIGEASATLVWFGSNASSLGLTPTGIAGVVGSSKQFSIHASIPIDGWNN